MEAPAVDKLSYFTLLLKHWALRKKILSPQEETTEKFKFRKTREHLSVNVEKKTGHMSPTFSLRG